MPKKTLLSWSSGKDSAWALHILRQNPDYQVEGLFCTVNSAFDRVAMHGVRLELLQAQAKHAGLPLQIIQIPYPCSNEAYAEIMANFVEQAQQQEISCFAFGDLFLQDIREYREQKLAGTGIEAIFPLWQIPTATLSQDMLAQGLKAVITCLDPKQIPEKFAGHPYNQSLLTQLPESVDPCGERGEFHTFCYAGPMFDSEIPIQRGETVVRDGFVFTDFLGTC